MDEQRDAACLDSANIPTSAIVPADSKKHEETTRCSERLGFRIVRLVLGVLLLTAAGFKAHALWTDPNPPLSVFSSPRWQLAFIEIETLLGFWLLSGISPPTVWIASLGVFSFLAGVSFFLATLGLLSCGCFGKVTINPWYTSTIDLLAIAALCYWRPKNQPFSVLIRETMIVSLRRSLRRLPAAILLFGALGAAIYALHRAEVFAGLRNESLTVEPAVLDIGQGANGEEKTVQVPVQNHTDRPIRITGGTANCRCVVIHGLPIIVPARTLAAIPMEITLVGGPGPFRKRFVLFTDDVNQTVVHAWLLGQISNGKE